MNNEIIHIMITSLCNRTCKYCCNKQYDLNDVPYVTHEELTKAHTILLTGGEPFVYSNPAAIATYYKSQYPNIKNVYVYTNAFELCEYLETSDNSLLDIDGVSVSIKTKGDRFAFYKIIQDFRIRSMRSNYLYVFGNLFPEITGNFKVIERKWQKNFVPDQNSIFRKV